MTEKMTVGEFVDHAVAQDRLPLGEGAMFLAASLAFQRESPEEYGPVERDAADWSREVDAWRLMRRISDAIELQVKQDRRTDPQVARDVEPVVVPLRNEDA